MGTLFFIAFLCWNISYRHLRFAAYEETKIYTQSNSTFEKEFGKRTLQYVNQWWQDPWEPIDNRRIFMHGMTNKGYLNARQSCSAESSARHNSNRPVQIYLRIASDYEQTNQKNTMWKAIFQHYPNLKIIFFNETCYFKNTALNNLYNSREWQKIPNNHKSKHLFKFSSLVSLFRGGGLFIDIDTVVTLKPLIDNKWWNFFVKNSITHSLKGPSHVTSSEIFHLEYGHHLSDEVILNISRLKYNLFVHT